MRRPRLCVCIPTYNGAAFLTRCLESVLAQTEVELRVILSDDASTDGTLAVAGQFDDPRLEVHSHDERLGLSGNWRRVWERADGDYAALVGQDDWLDPQWAPRLVGLLEAHRDADLAFGRRRFEFADEESHEAVGDFFERRYPEMLGPFHAELREVMPAAAMIREAMRFCFEINLIGEPSFVIVRRDRPAALEGFDANMRQMIDWEFFTRFFVDRPVVSTTESVGTYHIHAHAASIENSPLSRHYREFDWLIDRVRERFGERLDAEQHARLDARQAEVRELIVEWDRREASR